MARRGRRKPPSLGLKLLVTHPASESYEHLDPEIASRNQQQDEDRADDDGHRIDYEVREWKGEALLNLMVRRGMDARATSALLRKLADHFDRHPQLLSLRQGDMGEIVHGELERSCLSLADLYDDMGNLAMPEIS